MISFSKIPRFLEAKYKVKTFSKYTDGMSYGDFGRSIILQVFRALYFYKENLKVAFGH